MSILDMFRSAPAQPVPISAQKTPGNFPANPASVPDPSNPTNPVSTSTPTEPQSPLDNFQKLWETDPNAKPNTPAPLFAGLDAAKLQEAAKNNDFTKVITPEMAAALNKGGPEATQVLISAMNAMTQKGFGDGAFATTKIVEQALAKQQEQFMAALPGIIKNQNLSENLRTSNPLFANPAVAPMLEMMKNQVALKHPTLSAAEQAKMAQEYVIAFAEVANPAKQTAAQTAASKETDWSSFLS